MLRGQKGGWGLCDRLVGHGPFSRRGRLCVFRKIRPTASEHQVGPCVPTINQNRGLMSVQQPSERQQPADGRSRKNMRGNMLGLVKRPKRQLLAQKVCNCGC